MFTQLYLNDSFMIRKIIVAAVPAALVAVGMSLATSQPASSQCWRGRCHGGTTNTNQVYPNNQRGGSLNPGALQLSSGGGGATNANQIFPNNQIQPVLHRMHGGVKPSGWCIST